MATFQDASVGMVNEVTYKTGVTPTRFPEFTSCSMDFSKSIKQGKGLRVGGRVARSARRVVPTAMGKGDLEMECTSKGMGLLWQWWLGAGTSTNVSGATYQQVFTLADAMKSATMQVGLPEVGGSVDPYTWLGVVCDSFEVDFTNADIATVKATLNAGDFTSATSYATPSYVTTPTLFHFANGSITSGTLTPPTATTLASGVTTIADIRGGSFVVNHNNTENRYNFGGGGRQAQPTVGLRDITGKLDFEYDVTTYRDAVLNETPMNLIVTYTGAALSTGTETLQFIIPEIKLDSAFPATNGTDLIVQNVSFAGLDNLSAAQPIWIVTRTADTAL